MVNYNKLREFISDMEHQQWESWSRTISVELQKCKNLLLDNYVDNVTEVITILSNRLSRWKKNWKPYKKLKEDIKDFDREWADKILDNIPFKCPIYQCGGLMITKERPYPKGKNEDDYPDGMPGDSQLPDLVCQSCGAVYKFQKFK